MYLNRRELLTTNQRAELMKISDNITEKELVCYYTLSFEDIDTISIYRHGYNKLGFALQLTILRHSGWPLVEFTNIPMKIVHYVADQIDMDLKDFYKYFNRKNTKYDHLEFICKLFNYKKYNKNVERFLFDELLQITQSEINSFKFVNYALNILRENKVVNPSIRSVERIVWQAKENIQDSIFNLIDNSVTIVNKKQVDNLITVQDGDIKTKLSWLRGVPGKSSSKTFN